MTLSEYAKHFEGLSAKLVALALEMERHEQAHAHALNTCDGQAEHRARQHLHAALDKRLDLLQAANILKATFAKEHK